MGRTSRAYGNGTPRYRMNPGAMPNRLAQYPKPPLLHPALLHDEAGVAHHAVEIAGDVARGLVADQLGPRPAQLPQRRQRGQGRREAAHGDAVLADRPAGPAGVEAQDRVDGQAVLSVRYSLRLEMVQVGGADDHRGLA